MRRIALLTALVGCGDAGPEGIWVSPWYIDLADGTSRNNGLFVWDRQDVEATLYTTFEDESSGDVYLLEHQFEGRWDRNQAGSFLFTLQCLSESCTSGTEWRMACLDEEPGMVCDMAPDLYADDEASLQWVEL